MGSQGFLSTYDGSGSIKMVLTKDIASKVLQKNLAELILLATTAKSSSQTYSSQLQSSVTTIKIPDSMDIIEAVTENISSSYRSNGKLIVTDGANLVFFPPNEEGIGQKFSESVRRPLNVSDVQDRKVIKRLIEKALDISIKKATETRMMQGIYLLEEPISLYRCERAKLYLGFSVRVNIKEDNAAFSGGYSASICERKCS